MISSIGLFSAISGRTDYVLPIEKPLSVYIEQDTLPRFPVKKTEVSKAEDLEKNPPIDLKDPSNVKTEIIYDEKNHYYIFRTKVGDHVISTPFSMNPDEYMDYTLKRSMNQYFKEKNSEALLRGTHKDDYSLKDMKLNVGADKLFGPGGLKIQTNGYVEMKMGVKHTRTDNPTLSENMRGKTSFDFDENIQLNVKASVGDKINFDMNYDTESMFDFDSKKIKLAYDAAAAGDEDGILRRIEAGNVSMSTTNSLINGGTSLFGITSELQFGKLKVNTVISQQESESRTINTEGSIQNTDYEFKVDQYDENRHFFLSHYFRDNYDQALSKLPLIQSAVKIKEVEVWITNRRANFDQARNIVAFADIAENSTIYNSRWNASGYSNPDNRANDLYSTINSSYTEIRDIAKVTNKLNNILENGLDYEKVENARLLTPAEYTVDLQLGYISLNTALQPDEVLAVAYSYTINGKDYQVGEFSTDILDKYDAANPKSGALFVKMLKSVSFSPHSYTWHLMMKNVYYLGATDIQKEGFRLNISYQSDTLGTYINYLPEGAIKNKLLIKVMGVDRLDSKGNARKDEDGNMGDGIFDYQEGLTIRSSNGRVYFPVVEPFGKHLETMIGNPTIAKKYVYQELYDSTLTVAQQIAEKNKFKIYGSFRGTTSSSMINLNATNIPQGSVRITAGGVVLVENVDYIVDYVSGWATIINQNILDSNTPLQVNLEDRTFSRQRKTLMGLNLSYDFSKNFNVGATIMHLSEKPYTLRTEVGSESVKNTLWGVNMSYNTQSQWLTNLVDKLPFVNATQPSQISFNGEFAHMIAGHYQNDKLGGYSFLDDFEASQSNIDLKSPYAWTLAPTPYNRNPGADDPKFPEADITSDTIAYGKNRAMLSWFTIDPIFTRKNSSLTPTHIKNDKEQLSNHFVREVYLKEIYPYKDVAYNESATLPVLNLSYYPTERGPYNLDVTDINDDGSLQAPYKRWAGIMRRMDVRDFEAANVEYIEFWLMDPFVYNGTSTNPNKGGDLYINLGDISEDILKDGRKFYENGLPANNDLSAVEYTPWGKVPTRQSTVYAFDNNIGDDGRRRQDVGLNGLSTDEELQYSTYADYLATYRSRLSGTALSEQLQDPFSPFNDPARDNFRYYRGSYYDEHETSILDRYKFYNGTEGNSFAAEGTGENYSTAARAVPDVEDIDQDNTMNENEAYYQYKISLRPGDMNIGDNYIVDSRKVEVPLRDGTNGEITWYQFKVPVRAGKSINNFRDFKSIRFMRMFLTNFEQTTFLRFGTLQLVRGDWRIYEQSLNLDDTKPSGNGTIDISTINVEENGDRQPVNYILPPGVTRMSDPDQTQLIKENEQAMSIKIMDLDAQDARAIYKNTMYDLRRYKRIQMFTHAESLLSDPDLQNGELTVFMRLGTDYKNNYYEYEIPLILTPAGRYNSNSQDDRYAVWPEANMFDFPLELFTNLKLNRNKEKRKANSKVSYVTLYSEYDPDKRNNKISIKGNPSLGEVSVIMIGIRNNSRSEKSGEVWINELRLTDFDDKGGWAAQGNLNVALSDIGSVNISGRKETVGFGALDQSLLERRADDYEMYNIAVNMDMGRFLPEQAKLTVPLYYAYSKQTSTPEYDPFDTDITLKESLRSVESKAEKDSIKSLAQDKTTSHTISLSNVKLNIQSKNPMPYDPANFTFGYSYSKSETNNPTTTYDISQDYRLSMAYQYTPLIKTWEPFKNLESNSGAAKFAKSLGFNYLPNNIAFNSNISRFYTETVIRDIESYVIGGTNNSEFLSWSQEFYWDRDFSINWDLTKNLKLSFRSGTRAEIEEPYLQVNKKQNRDKYEIWRDSVMHSIRNLGTPLSYRQVADVTFQLPFQNIPAMNWINSSINYNSGYNWDRGAQSDTLEIGNSISNNMTLTFNNRLNMTSLYNKSSFLRKVNERFDSRRGNQTALQREREEKARESRRKRVNETITLIKDSVYTLTHNLDTKNLEIKARANGKSYNLKYKKKDNNTILITNNDSIQVEIDIATKEKGEMPAVWRDILEYSARGLMSVRTISVNYSKRTETHISGFRPMIGDAFGQKNSDYGLVPGMGFAFGLDGGEDFIEKSLDRDWLVLNNMNNVTPAIYNNAEKLEMRAQLEPFKGMRIELNASREKNDRTEIQYMYDGSPKTKGGSFSMTTVALSSALRSSSAGNDYHSDAFDKFIQNRDIIRNRVETKYSGTKYPDAGFIKDENPLLAGDPYTPGSVNPNSADVLIPAFLAAYTGKDANKISLSAFPSLASLLPNWTMSYDGLTNIPAIKNHFKNIKINHAYSCFYQIGSYGAFTNWVDAGGDDLGFIRDVLNGNPVPSSPYNISSVSITEMFNPLFGVESILNNNMTIGIRYNHSRMLNLNIASYQIIESLQKDWVIGVGYKINEFNRIIGMTSRNAQDFNNDLNIRADLSFKTDYALIRKIEEQYTQATSGTDVVTIKLSADYTVSKAFSVRAFFDKIINKPLITSSGYPTANTNYGISLKFTLLQ